MSRLLSERDLIRRAAIRDLPRTPIQNMIRALVRVAVLCVVSAIIWLIIVEVFSLQVPRP